MKQEMNELYTQLLAQARLHDAVATAVLAGGTRLFIYPLERGVLLALGAGTGGGQALRAETLLRRRGADLRRLGAWLPALFNDGSWYLVRRCADSEANGLDDNEWLAAEELLR
ncbi:hypothetical protein SAMN05518865_106264 [Duganella sp. CF458]|uniref:hypothetical protein n=1 Tax=Duganella sp. CF458 TaxID=1884368 RepID=UPI0008EC24B1|nr:hypothetical protein [Duganella sp. CF458]SFF95430.1 hypothetical protein SAMN05518865_106264 [Duganella sp. CF458]